MARVSKKAAAAVPAAVLDAAVPAAAVLDAAVLDAAVLDAAVLDAAVLDAAVLDAAVLEPIARQALGEITRSANVGALRDVVVADDVATVRFATTQGGYLGWFWTVSIAVNPGLEPSVLETELMPAEGALLAPEWVPWADRLEEYLAQQALEGGADELDDEDDELDDDDDELDDDDDELDDEGEIDGGHLADDEADALDDHLDEHDLHGDDGDDVFDGVDIDLHLDDEPHAP